MAIEGVRVLGLRYLAVVETYPCPPWTIRRSDSLVLKTDNHLGFYSLSFYFIARPFLIKSWKFL
jgi:hypothetical protein